MMTVFVIVFLVLGLVAVAWVVWPRDSDFDSTPEGGDDA